MVRATHVVGSYLARIHGGRSLVYDQSMHQKLDEARAVQSIQQKETDLYFPLSYEQQKKTLHPLIRLQLAEYHPESH